MEITINQNENQNISISNDDIQEININENDNQLINVNSNTPQDINVNENDSQIILINGGGEVIGITDVLVNGVTVVSGNIAYITVPTLVSQLVNNAGYITSSDIPSETDPTVPSYVKAISLADINSWNNKQDELVSGSNIKTINNTSLLGSGNIDISGGGSYIAGTGINIEDNIISNTITSYNDLTDLPSIPDSTSQLINDSDFVSEDDLAEVAFTGSYNSLSDTPIIPDSTSQLTNDSNFVDENLLNLRLLTKQDKLISGTNIKTINSNSILGSGDLTIGGGTSTDVQINGTSIVSNDVANIITESAYNETTNKIATKNDLPTKTSDLTNDSNFAKTDIDNNWNYEQTVNGYDLILGTQDSTTDDSSDIRWTYGNKDEKARLWIVDVPSSTDYRPHYRVKDTSGNNIVNSTLATIDDIPDINIFKIARCTKSITVPSGDSSQTLFAPPTISGYTFLGIMNYLNGYGDNWLVSYSLYAGNIVASIRSKWGATLTSNINVSLLYIKNDYITNNVSTYNF